MKVLLYTENEKLIGKSGLGKAIRHQIKALELAGVEYTLNKDDDYDILHINTYFPKSYLIAKKAKKNGKKIVYHAHSTEEDYKNGFICSNITSKMFKHCNSLQKLDLSNFDTTKVMTMKEMFNDCNSLKKINLSTFKVNDSSIIKGMFSACYLLEDIGNCNDIKILKEYEHKKTKID